MTHSGRENGGRTRASEKAMGDRENGLESTVSIGVGCCLIPLGTWKLVLVDGRRDVSCGSWLPVTGKQDVQLQRKHYEVNTNPRQAWSDYQNLAH